MSQIEILKKYGLPTALAMALMGLVVYLVHTQMEMVSDQLEFISRLVDKVCEVKIKP